MYRDRYGCDVTIQLRKYDSISKLWPTDIRRGKLFSTFETESELWFDKQADKIQAT